MDKFSALASFYISQSGSIRNALSAVTKAKLSTLNINLENISSEYEAKKVIAKAEENIKKEQIQKQKTKNKNEIPKQNDDVIYTRLKNLALKMGMTITQSENISSIFENIKIKFKEFEESGYGSNIGILKSEFESIELQFKNINSNGSVLNALDLLGQNNRAMLGI